MSIQYTMLGFEPTTFKFESPHITTHTELICCLLVTLFCGRVLLLMVIQIFLPDLDHAGDQELYNGVHGFRHEIGTDQIKVDADHVCTVATHVVAKDVQHRFRRLRQDELVGLNFFTVFAVNRNVIYI